MRSPIVSTPLPFTTVQFRSSLSASTVRAPMKRTKSASVLPLSASIGKYALSNAQCEADSARSRLRCRRHCRGGPLVRRRH